MDEQATSELRKFVATELDLGFTLMDTARLSRDSGHTEHAQEAIQKARLCCETAQRFIVRLPAADTARFQPRLDALCSIVFSAPGTGRASSMHG